VVNKRAIGVQHSGVVEVALEGLEAESFKNLRWYRKVVNLTRDDFKDTRFNDESGHGLEGDCSVGGKSFRA
jgi:hypothetical protein